jgi:hypothetical protein
MVLIKPDLFFKNRLASVRQQNSFPVLDFRGAVYVTSHTVDDTVGFMLTMGWPFDWISDDDRVTGLIKKTLMSFKTFGVISTFESVRSAAKYLSDKTGDSWCSRPFDALIAKIQAHRRTRYFGKPKCNNLDTLVLLRDLGSEWRLLRS